MVDIFENAVALPSGLLERCGETTSDDSNGRSSGSCSMEFCKFPSRLLCCFFITSSYSLSSSEWSWSSNDGDCIVILDVEFLNSSIVALI